jgi:hypothetical protein
VSIEVIQLVQVAYECAFKDDTHRADDQRREDQHQPVVESQVLQPHPCDEGAEHVERPVGEIDDVQQAENHCQPERQYGIERAIDQAQ